MKFLNKNLATREDVAIQDIHKHEEAEKQSSHCDEPYSEQHLRTLPFLTWLLALRVWGLQEESSSGFYLIYNSSRKLKVNRSPKFLQGGELHRLTSGESNILWAAARCNI